MTQAHFSDFAGFSLLIVILAFLVHLVVTLKQIRNQLRRIADAGLAQADYQQRLVEIELPVLSSALGDISQSLDAATAPIDISSPN